MQFVTSHQDAMTVSSDTRASFLLRLPPPPNHHMLDKEALLHALSQAVMQAKAYGGPEAKKRVLSVLIQRIGAMAMLPRKAVPLGYA